MRMTFGLWASALLCVALTTGCDDAGPVEGGETSGSSGGGDSTTSTTAAPTTSSAPTTDPVTSTTAPGTTTTTTTTTTTDPTTAGDETTEDTACTAGELGCMCDGGACDEGLVCDDDDTCTPSESCDGDDLEPNNDEDLATFIGEFNDDDDNGSSIEGVLSGPGDVDWYRYTGDDDSFATVDPTRFIEATAGVRMCKFAECLNGLPNTEVTCPNETEAAMSPTGRPGCCAPLGIEIDDINCSGTTDDSMDIYIRVDEAEAACVDYEITFHY